MSDSRTHHEASAPGGARGEPSTESPLIKRLRDLLLKLTLAVAVVAPLGMALWQSSQATQWRDDAPLVRGMTLALSPGNGAISSLLIALMTALPVGSVVTRASMVPALAVAVLAWLLFHAVLDALAPLGRRWFFPFVAMASTLTACLSSSVQREATIAGGATVAAALVLASWNLARRAAQSPGAPAGWALGLLIGAAACESLLAGVIALLIAVVTVVSFQRRDQRLLASAAFGLGVSIALVMGVAWVRPMTGGLGGLLAGGSLQGALIPLDISALHTRPIEGWLRDLGVVGSVLATLGFLACVRGAALRSVVLTAGALVVIDVFSPSANAGAFTAEPWSLVRVVAACAVGIPAAVGVIFAGRFLVSTRAPFARPAAILIGVFHAALVFVAAEDASIRVDRSAIRASGAWTSEAVEHLPASAMTLIRSEPLAWRLLAAQVGQGLRPDIVIVPQPLLTHPGLAVSLLRAEPALAPMLREIATAGQPSEYSLSTLADARPLFVELDPRWDRKLVTHTIPEHLWLRFSSQSYGGSERKVSSDAAAFDRVVMMSTDLDHRDDATLQILVEQAKARAQVATMIGEKMLAEVEWARFTALSGEAAPKPEPIRPKTGRRVRRFLPCGIRRSPRWSTCPALSVCCS